jgi:hypothetical protein
MTDDVTAHGMDSEAIIVYVETHILVREMPDEGICLFSPATRLIGLSKDNNRETLNQ